MPPTYQQNKAHIYNWREHNRDRYREIARLSEKKRYAYKKVCREFRNILIDDFCPK